MKELFNGIISRIPTRTLIGIVLLAAVATVLGIAQMNGDSQTQRAQPAPQPVPASDSPATAAPSPSSQPTGTLSVPPSSEPADIGHDGDHGEIEIYTPPPSAPAPQEAAATVASFMTAWLKRSLTSEQWWAGVAPYCEQSYAAQLRTVDPGRVPAGKVTGPLKLTDSRTDTAVYEVPTDNGTLKVTVTTVDGSWKVTDSEWRR